MKKSAPIDIEVWPYCEIDGVRTFSDSLMAGLVGQMVREEKFDSVFYATPETPASVVAYWKHQCETYVIGVDEAPGAMLWLTDHTQTSAMAHFTAFNSIAGKTVAVGKAALRHVFGLKHRDGRPRFEVLVGVTPETNTAALMFLPQLGYTMGQTVPGLCYLHKEKRSVAGVFNFIHRKAVING